MTSQRIKVQGRIYIATTLAAASANMCYQHFSRLCGRDLGPTVHYIQDGKYFYDPKEVKAWARNRRKARKKPCGRKAKQELRKMHFHFFLGIDQHERFRQKYPGKPLGPFIREILEEKLRHP